LYASIAKQQKIQTFGGAKDEREIQHHKIRGIEQLAEMLREETRKAMESVSAKITELYELEKTAWGDLDEIEVKNIKMVEDVEKITANQVRYVPHLKLYLQIIVELLSFVYIIKYF